MRISVSKVSVRLTFLLVTCMVSGTLISESFAYPTNSPSARAAARLKHRPPANWIRHYLGDDRYKIAGGVWKVVSTEVDRYYYPAWAPEMLRQPPGTVIGFPSAAAAQEAGYLPSGYPTDNSLYGLTPAEIAAARRRAVSAARAGTRITLSDGRSTVILPRGWRHTRVGSQNFGAQGSSITYQADMLAPPGGQSGVMFAFMTMPGSANVESFLSPQRVEEMKTQMRQRAGSDANFARSLEGARIGQGKLGGLTGLTVVPGKGANLPSGMAGRMTIVGRGSKMYIMSAQMPRTDRNYGVIVNSFQPR